jgi:hypothetical protein
VFDGTVVATCCPTARQRAAQRTESREQRLAAGMALVVWISELFTTILTSYFQDRKPIHYHRKYEPSNVILDLGLANISKHEIDKITTKLIQRGFSMGPFFSYKDANNSNEEKCVLTIILTPELLKKLSIQYGVPFTSEKEDTSPSAPSHSSSLSLQRTYLAIKSIEIIERADIRCNLFLIHNQIELERMTNTLSSISSPTTTASSPTATASSPTASGSSSRELHELTLYFGQSTSVFFSWMKYTLLWLHFSSLFGLLIFSYQLFIQFKLELSFTPLLCVMTSLGSLFYEKTLQQHLSLSLFAWGNVSMMNYLPSPVMPGFSFNVHPIPPLITALLMSFSLSLFYLAIIILIQYLEVQGGISLSVSHLSQSLSFPLTLGIVLSRSVALLPLFDLTSSSTIALFLLSFIHTSRECALGSHVWIYFLSIRRSGPKDQISRPRSMTRNQTSLTSC